jgi:outer membrane receptor protein involved in Fe transport
MLKRLLFLLTITMLASSFVYSQVTTSSITGVVKSQSGEGLEGATVTAVHMPSNTTYNTLSKKGGNFTLPSLRIGGPYTLSINYVGQTAQSIPEIYLTLGEPYNTNVVMGESNQQLTSVVVSTSRRKQPDRTGASTNISREQLATLPTISRSITDFTRLTPQANGTNFGGRDSRYNNTVIDGANLNNNFGLSTDLLPGGGSNPISLDALDEITVSIAPFDVRQSNFTGAAINAVTKSGTNTYHGSAYGYYRDQSFNGTKIRGNSLGTVAPTKNTIFGVTLGGPIIKDKVFFFISAEKEKRNSPPSQVWTPKGGSGSGNISTVDIYSLRKFSEYLKSAYGYETGGYDFVPNFDFENRKLLVKIDWNINKTHKLTAKYSDFENTNGVQLNATSLSFFGGSYAVKNGTGTATITGAMPNPRVGQNALSFANSNYGFRDVVRTASLELNSNFRGKFSNQLLATMTKIQDTRTSPSQVFPFIEIFNNDGKNYMSAGYEPFSYNNDVLNNVYSITDNFTYYYGKHTFTAGANYEFQKVGNQFMSGSQSFYAYNSLNDFITNQAPAAFSLTYSLVKGESSPYSANLKYGQLGLYLQDEYNVNSRLKLTGGLRIDKPVYPEQPLENPKITELTFPDKDGVNTHYSTGMWPEAKVYWSPRVGLRYDVYGDKKLIIRGGVGIFTGRIPFAWLTNMPTGSGMYQSTQNVNSASTTTSLQNYKFNPDPLHYVGTFPNVAGTFVPSAFALIDPQFRFAQVWRNNIAFDRRFGKGWTVTGEVLYSKDLNAVIMRNANQKAPDATFTGSDNRARYSNIASSGVGRRIYPAVASAIVLENTDEGFSGSATAMIAKAANRGFYGSLAYTFSTSMDVTANPGSTAASVWSGNFAVGTQNDQELYNSQYVLPHRLVGSLSYRFEYAKHFATTVSLFFEGASQGSTSFINSNDMNGDGNSSDLLYIPKDANDIIFLPTTAAGTTTARTAQEQSDAFFQYINNIPYLRDHKGQYAERNGAYLPWYNRVDAKILQDIFTNIGKDRHTIQVSLDIINLSNLINNDWGIRQQVTYRNPLAYVDVDASGRPRYRMNQVGGQLPTDYKTDILSTSTTWGLQLGLRYIF